MLFFFHTARFVTSRIEDPGLSTLLTRLGACVIVCQPADLMSFMFVCQQRTCAKAWPTKIQDKMFRLQVFKMGLTKTALETKQQQR